VPPGAARSGNTLVGGSRKKTPATTFGPALLHKGIENPIDTRQRLNIEGREAGSLPDFTALRVLPFLDLLNSLYQLSVALNHLSHLGEDTDDLEPHAEAPQAISAPTGQPRAVLYAACSSSRVRLLATVYEMNPSGGSRL
jgi:hypothetical protein